MGLFGSLLVNLYGDKKKMRQIGREYYINILIATQKQPRDHWESMSDQQLRKAAMEAKKRHD